MKNPESIKANLEIYKNDSQFIKNEIIDIETHKLVEQAERIIYQEFISRWEEIRYPDDNRCICYPFPDEKSWVWAMFLDSQQKLFVIGFVSPGVRVSEEEYDKQIEEDHNFFEQEYETKLGNFDIREELRMKPVIIGGELEIPECEEAYAPEEDWKLIWESPNHPEWFYLQDKRTKKIFDRFSNYDPMPKLIDHNAIALANTLTSSHR